MRTLFLSVILSSVAITSSGQNHRHPLARAKWQAGVEYLAPADDDRNIRTVTADLTFGGEFIERAPLYIGIGLTATYAWGDIMQWENDAKVRYDNNAAGIGPMIVARFEPQILRGFSVFGEFSGGFILYTRRFPSGGDIYNFMWRWGGGVNYRISRYVGIGAQYKWMHVSNGQGLGPQNPSYEGRGVSITYSLYLPPPHYHLF